MTAWFRQEIAHFLAVRERDPKSLSLQLQFAAYILNNALRDIMQVGYKECGRTPMPMKNAI